MDKKLYHLLYPVVFVAAFLFAVNLFNLFYAEYKNVPEVETELVFACSYSPHGVNIFDLSVLSEKHVNSWIITDGFVHFKNGQFILYPNKCLDESDFESFPALEIKKIYGSETSLKKILKEKKLLDKELNVRVEGTLEYHLEKNGEKHLKIIIDDISRIEPIWAWENENVECNN